MGYPTRVQLIKRKSSHQWYVNFPAAIAEAMEFEKSELVEWVVENNRGNLMVTSEKSLSLSTTTSAA